VNIQVIDYNEDHNNVDRFDVHDNAGLPEQENDNDMGVDDIKVIHHPSARIEERVFAFDDYCGTDSFRPEPSGVAPLSSEDLERPWRPFRTKLDFEVAEVVLDAHMNTLQTEKLLALIHEAIRDPESFTLANSKDLSSVWDFARSTRTDKVGKFPILIILSLISHNCAVHKENDLC